MNQEESKAVAQMAAVLAEMASLSWCTQEQMDIARKASAALRGWLGAKECARVEAQKGQVDLADEFYRIRDGVGYSRVDGGAK